MKKHFIYVATLLMATVGQGQALDNTPARDVCSRDYPYSLYQAREDILAACNAYGQGHDDKARKHFFDAHCAVSGMGFRGWLGLAHQYADEHAIHSMHITTIAREIELLSEDILTKINSLPS